jgi:predicted AAA+ superfamily ATPase
MKKISLEDAALRNKNIKERDFVGKITDFIDSRRCYHGNILVLYGLRRTGKTTAMEQALLKLPKDVKCAFYELDDKDEIADVERTLVEERHNGVTVICFDEITKAEDFITNSASLPDIFAKMGMRIIVTGTDSLGFRFADYRELYGRSVRLNTTHISFAEHCRVLGTNDIDDYIQYGGLMREGADERFVYDYETARRYLDSAVAENICSSIKNNYHSSCLDDLSVKELRCIIEKIVELYSGFFDRKTILKEIKNVSVNFPVNKLPEIGTDENVIEKLTIEKENITKDFLKKINADAVISHTITEEMAKEIRDCLFDMHVLSLTMKITYSYEEGKEFWKSRNKELEIYVVQPAIKYFHLQEGKRFIEDEKYYAHLSPEEKNFMQKRLDEKIKGDMTEQIIVFDVDAALPTERYSVLKPCFTINGKSAGEYDMLVFDKEKCCYWGFEIKHTTNAFYKQEQHLQNDKITSFMNREYGKREHVCVLYRGKPFVSSTRTIYLNITDFCLAVDKYRDMDRVFEELAKGLEVRDLVAEYKAQTGAADDGETDITSDKKHKKGHSGIGKD